MGYGREIQNQFAKAYVKMGNATARGNLATLPLENMEGGFNQ